MEKIPDYYNNPDFELLSKLKLSIDSLDLNASNAISTCFMKTAKSFNVSEEYVRELVLGSKFPANSSEESIYNYACHLVKNNL